MTSESLRFRTQKEPWDQMRLATFSLFSDLLRPRNTPWIYLSALAILKGPRLSPIHSDLDAKATTWLRISQRKSSSMKTCLSAEPTWMMMDPWQPFLQKALTLVILQRVSLLVDLSSFTTWTLLKSSNLTSKRQDWSGKYLLWNLFQIILLTLIDLF